MKPYYEGGGITIYHGDCEAVLATLTGQARLIFTSPPYNLGDGSFAKMVRGGGTWNPRRSRWSASTLARGYDGHDDAMPYEDYVTWQQAVLRACWAALTDDGAIFYNHKPRPWKQTYGTNGGKTHSAKPPAFFDLVERVSPAPRVELFARAPRLGWDHWGRGYESIPMPRSIERVAEL